TLGQTLRPGGQFARLETKLRSQLRQSMNAELVRLSGFTRAEMRWTLDAYLERVFYSLGFKLVGWPPDVPFANLSNFHGLPLIKHIRSQWTSGVMHFAPVTDADRENARRDRLSAAPGSLSHDVRTPSSRSDIKARRDRPKTNPENLPYRHVRNGPKSAKEVSAEAEAAADAEVWEARERAAASEI
ncbi:hypothetical protein BD310DRAFT_774055, partial [Dichomitus squalens]